MHDTGWNLNVYGILLGLVDLLSVLHQKIKGNAERERVRWVAQGERGRWGIQKEVCVYRER